MTAAILALCHHANVLRGRDVVGRLWQSVNAHVILVYREL